MTAETEARAAVVAAAGVTALVGTRVYPMKLRQGATLPAVTYQRAGTAPVNSMSGDTSSLDQVRIQYDAYASTHGAAEEVTTAIRAALRSNPRFVYIDERDFDYDDETATYRRMIEFYIWFKGE